MGTQTAEYVEGALVRPQPELSQQLFGLRGPIRTTPCLKLCTKKLRKCQSEGPWGVAQRRLGVEFENVFEFSR